MKCSKCGAVVPKSVENYINKYCLPSTKVYCFKHSNEVILE